MRWLLSLAVTCVIVAGAGWIVDPAAAQPVIGFQPGIGPICMGPLGPGPCALVQRWIATHGGGGVPLPPPQIPLPTLPKTFDAPPQLGAPTPQVVAPFVPNSVGGAVKCAKMTGQDRQVNVDAFLACTRGALVLNPESMALVDCAEQTGSDEGNFGKCAGNAVIGSQLTSTQRRVVGCAAEHSDDSDDFAGCVANGLLANQLNDQQRAVLDCATSNNVASTDFATCAGGAMLGDHIPPAAKVAIGCAAESQGDLTGFAGCAAGKFLNTNLNPEQRIAIECVVTTGGQPYAAASCAAARLTARELTRCATNGFGGSDGCFGDNNDLVGRNGYLVRRVGALAGGPNSFIRDPGQVMGGPNSFFNNPRQVLGGPSSVPNQLLRNIPSPPPIEVGRIGNHRVCIPWC